MFYRLLQIEGLLVALVAVTRGPQFTDANEALDQVNRTVTPGAMVETPLPDGEQPATPTFASENETLFSGPAPEFVMSIQKLPMHPEQPFGYAAPARTIVPGCAGGGGGGGGGGAGGCVGTVVGPLVFRFPAAS